MTTELQSARKLATGAVPGVTKPITRLVQGTVMIKSETLDESFALLDAIFELGCNTFDTAHVYGGGDNERTVGRWVNDRRVREQVVIIGKGAHHNADRRRVTPFDITADVHDSLARFKFDYIDLYLLHRDDPNVPVGPIVEVLNEHLRAGRIRAFGGSNWSVQRIQQANDYAKAHGLVPFAFSSPYLSLARQVEEPWENCFSVSGPGEAEVKQRQWYQETKFPLFAWSSLAGGFFSGRLMRENQAEHLETLYMRCYGCDDNFQRLERAQILSKEKGATVPQIALAYVMNQPLTVFALVGCRSRGEFQDNMDALKIQLTPDEMAWLDLRRDHH
ncbi:MAG: aldo/keto reductase [Candidatus Hydrogenedentes bacterium]|nr:aldo/keto reductase [Candidatus Hydrogenedentota bacterium]